MILGIDTDKFYTLGDAKEALEGCPKVNFGEPYHDIYFYEMWPLVKILEYLTNSSNNAEKLRFSDGKRSDDGIISFNGREQEFQFVLALDGYQESIRIEHRDRYGRAPGIQELTWEGNQYNRILPNQDTKSFEPNEILSILKSKINDAIEIKIKPWNKGMWLGVVFDDLLPASEETTNNYREVCDHVLQTYGEDLKEIYPKVFFVVTNPDNPYIRHYDL